MQSYNINGHLTLAELNEKNTNQYLQKISPDNGYKIPAYPRPELHITHVSHSTQGYCLEGIKVDGGFKGANENVEMKVVWFSLTVTPEDLSNAETRPMTIVRPGGVEEQSGPIRGEAEGETSGPGVLRGFATSPSFLSSSRYGSYRFTFDLKDVLEQYSEQFCGGNPPVMRQWKTVLYKQEVMYVVLVHSPDEDRFSEHPLLEDTENSICAFRMEPEPYFVWRPQAMCDTHRLELVGSGETVSVKTYVPEFFVWDHVALALVIDEELLRFDDNKLWKSLRFCEKGYPPINNTKTFESYDDANKTVRNLWPDSGDLEK